MKKLISICLISMFAIVSVFAEKHTTKCAAYYNGELVDLQLLRNNIEETRDEFIMVIKDDIKYFEEQSGLKVDVYLITMTDLAVTSDSDEGGTTCMLIYGVGVYMTGEGDDVWFFDNTSKQYDAALYLSANANVFRYEYVH